MNKISVVVSGGFGTSLAIMLAKRGNQVVLWSKFSEEIEALKRDREHKKLLPGVEIPEGVLLTSDLSEVAESDLYILAAPSFAVRETAERLKPYINEKSIVATVGKGFESGSMKRLSEVVSEILPCPVVAISGPCHAEEVARGMPTSLVAACEDARAAEYVQDILMSETMRVYVNTDILSVELGGALKNVIALSAGVVDGMGYGDNTKAALITRGMVEMSRLGAALGGNVQTFAGLSGMGDLFVTCTSMHSRNRRAGILIGQGTDVKTAIETIGTVEGYLTSKIAYELCKKAEVEMPIIEQVYHVLYEGKPVHKAVSDLMGRPKKHETEESFIK